MAPVLSAELLESSPHVVAMVAMLTPKSTYDSLMFQMASYSIFSTKKMDFWQIAPCQARTSIKIDPNDAEAWAAKAELSSRSV
jgi:hypothetical protein